MAGWLHGGSRCPGWGGMGLPFGSPSLGGLPDLLRGRLESWFRGEAVDRMPVSLGCIPSSRAVHPGFAQHADSPTGSTHLGVNEKPQQIQALPLSLRSQDWKRDQVAGFKSQPAALARLRPGNFLLLEEMKSCQFVRHALFSLISVDP